MPLASPLTDNLQGWGTAAGALVAVFAVVAAVLAYRSQNRQLRLQQTQIADQQALNQRQSDVLALQAKDLEESLAERKRETEERRRSQAVRVFTWTEQPVEASRGHSGQQLTRRYFTHLRNASPLPIRNIDVCWHQGTAAWGQPDRVPYLGPGEQGDFERSLDLPPNTPPQDNPSSYGAVVEFDDADGQRWRLNLSGRLEEWRDPGGWTVVRDAPGER